MGSSFPSGISTCRSMLCRFNYSYTEANAVYEWQTTPGTMALIVRAFSALWFGYSTIYCIYK